MYQILIEENGELLKFELGTISEFTNCWHAQIFLERVHEEIEGFEGVPLNDCIVRRFSRPNDQENLHRTMGPALTIEHMASGHTYFRLCANSGLKHDLNGPALIADDNHINRNEYFQKNVEHNPDGPQTRLELKETGLVIEEEWLLDGVEHRIGGPSSWRTNYQGGLNRQSFYVHGVKQSNPNHPETAP